MIEVGPCTSQKCVKESCCDSGSVRIGDIKKGGEARDATIALTDEGDKVLTMKSISTDNYGLAGSKQHIKTLSRYMLSTQDQRGEKTGQNGDDDVSTAEESGDNGKPDGKSGE